MFLMLIQKEAAVLVFFDVRSGSTGSLGTNGVSNAIRPAISLVSDITISGGTGTSEDPYVVN